MGKLILRAIAPIGLFGCGIASLIYGAAYHAAPVSKEQEMEIDVPLPPEFLPPGQPPSVEFPPGMTQPPFGQKIVEKVIVTADKSEPALIREITFGGVTLLASGEIRQTYTGEPPSLCPT
jgi:hypothetical protein